MGWRHSNRPALSHALPNVCFTKLGLAPYVSHGTT